MSLVAYDYSSEENSDEDDNDPPKESLPSKEALSLTESQVITTAKPSPSDSASQEKNDPIEDEESTTHLPLPAPKKVTNDLNVEEEDDEFLHKKAAPELKPSPLPTSLNSIRPNVKNGKVQITIPSLKDFKDDDVKPKSKPIIGAELPAKSTGLLGILPKPKSELGFSTASSSNQNGSAATTVKPIVHRLIPDSVANRPRNVQPEPKLSKNNTIKKTEPPSKRTEHDSEDSEEDEKLDFFSLNMEEKLPEISANEIHAMVAKRAAKMAAATQKFEKPDISEDQPSTSGLQQHESQLVNDADDLANERALSTLIGGNKAKRARLDEVNIIDITSADIVPSKEDFLRRQLQEQTGYVPTGHLTGDWTCTSKRKSHITYLASKAQANAQELEAMWSANRQTKRQTQSKYGF